MLQKLFALLVMLIAGGAFAREGSIEGRVVLAGRPVASALVAAIPLGPREWWSVAGTARTDRSGVFRITGLEPGQYALTATSDRYAAGYVAKAETANSSPVVIAMEKSGRRLTGRARHADGTPLQGRVKAARSSPLDGDLFVVDADDEGHFMTVLPPGRYRLFAEAADGMIEAAANLEEEDAEVDLQIERVYRVTPPAVIDWIRHSAAQPEDVKALRSVIGSARVVALGEATHGTHEFFEIRHRMFQILVREMGFSVLAIEASAPDVAVVNDYVLHGKGDPETAVAGLDFWAWRTSEIVETIRWMRAWNEEGRHTTKLRLHGFDMQNPSASVSVLRDYLLRVDPEFARSAGSFDAETLDAVERRLRDHRDAYAARSSQVDWIWARRQVDLIRQGSDLLRASAGAFEVRDRWMAANVKWILDHEPPGAKMVVWAHNGHVAAEPPRFFPGGSMGMHLRRIYGEAFRIFGFAFDRGGFRAASAGGEVRSHESLPAKTASFDGALAAVGLPLFFLDLRTATGLPRRWVESPLEHRSIGLTYNPETPGNDWVTIHPIRSYDAVIFVGKTSPSHVRPSPPAKTGGEDGRRPDEGDRKDE